MKTTWEDTYDRLAKCMEESPKSFKRELEAALRSGFPIDFEIIKNELLEATECLLTRALGSDNAIKYDVPKILLNHGADPNMCVNYDEFQVEYPIETAIANQVPLELIRYLIYMGARISLLGRSSGFTSAFDCAAWAYADPDNLCEEYDDEYFLSVMRLLIDCNLRDFWRWKIKFLSKKETKEEAKKNEEWDKYDEDILCREEEIIKVCEEYILNQSKNCQELMDYITESRAGINTMTKEQMDKTLYDLTDDLFLYPEKVEANLREALAKGFPIDYRINRQDKLGRAGCRRLLETAIDVLGAVQADIPELLISLGADVDIPDEDGIRPLELAVMKCRSHKLLKYLIESGSDINARDRWGKTAFCRAAEADAYISGTCAWDKEVYIKIAQLLLDNDADPYLCKDWMDLSAVDPIILDRVERFKTWTENYLRSKRQREYEAESDITLFER